MWPFLEPMQPSHSEDDYRGEGEREGERQRQRQRQRDRERQRQNRDRETETETERQRESECELTHKYCLKSIIFPINAHSTRPTISPALQVSGIERLIET